MDGKSNITNFKVLGIYNIQELPVFLLFNVRLLQIALRIVHRGYQMNPPCPPFECAHMWYVYDILCSCVEGISRLCHIFIITYLFILRKSIFPGAYWTTTLNYMSLDSFLYLQFLVLVVFGQGG